LIKFKYENKNLKIFYSEKFVLSAILELYYIFLYIFLIKFQRILIRKNATYNIEIRLFSLILLNILLNKKRIAVCFSTHCILNMFAIYETF